MTRKFSSKLNSRNPQARSLDDGAKSCIFPTLNDHTPDEVQSLVWRVPMEQLADLRTLYKRDSSCLAPLLIAAWSITLHQFVASETVYFGVNTPEEITGLSSGDMVAFSVVIDKEAPIEQLLRACNLQLSMSQGERCNVHFNTGVSFITGDENSSCRPENPKEQLYVMDNERYDLLLIAKASNRSVELLLQYSTAVVSDKQAAILGGAVSRAAASLFRDPNQKLRDIDLLDQLSAEYISEWVSRRTDVACCSSSSIAEIIQGKSRCQPGAPAVCSWDGVLTYGELEDLSTKLAVYLKEKRVGPEVMVPVCFEKSMWAIVATLAVLKVGAAFVPIDPSHPLERLKQIIAQVNARVILSSDQHAALLAGATADVITVSDATAARLPTANQMTLPRAEAHNVAYVLFTSGSTGSPKGCVVDHRALAAVANHAEALQIRANTRALQFASFSFGVSLIEIFCTLTAGGTICIASDNERLNDLSGAVHRMNVNWALLTPSLMGSVDPDNLTGLKTLVVAGEPLREDLARYWARRVRLVLAYGLTEWAGICTVQHEMDLTAADPKNIGKSPSANLWLVNPDNHHVLAPIGAVAELLIEGPCLARGYLNDAELTAMMFIENPPWLHLFRSDRETRLYKTGDLVRYSLDGSLIYIGRKSLQAKIRGQRIELGEVEYQVGRHFAGATKVIVDVVTPISNTPSPILVAFVYSKNGQAPLTKNDPSGSATLFEAADHDFQSHSAETDSIIRDYLPGYMIPHLYVPLKYVPLTITGKINRRRLREIACSLSYEALASYTYTGSDIVAPDSVAEQRLHRLLSDVLELPSESFGVNESFFRLGGDSLRAMKLVTRCRAEGISITVQDVFREQTVSRLALLAGKHWSTVARRDEDSETKCNLSAVQQRMILAGEQGQSWCLPTACMFLRLKRRVDPIHLENAIRQVVRRHPMLRARFARDRNGAWVQYIPTIAREPSGGYEFSSRTVSTMEEALGLIEPGGKILYIEKGPVFRVSLLNLGESQYLSLAAHVLVVDHTSLGIISKDIEDFLGNVSVHRLKRQPLGFREWLCSNMEARHGQHEIPAPHPVTPMNISGHQPSPRTDDVSPGHSHGIIRQRVLLPPCLLGNAVEALRLSPSIVLQAVALYAFGRAFKDRELPLMVIEEDGRGLASRHNDFSETVGQFTTYSTLSVQSYGQSSFGEILRQAKESYQQARNGKTTHLTSSSGQQPLQGNLMRAPLPSILFKFLLPSQEQQWSGAIFEQVALEHLACLPNEQLAEGMIITVSESDNVPRMVFSGSAGTISRRDLDRWAQECRHSINEAVKVLEEKIPIFTPYDFPLLTLTRESLQDFLHCRLPEIDICPSDVEAAYPCSPIQQGMLISQARQPEHYQGLFLWEVISAGGHATIDADRLQTAWRQLTRRHSTLRTIFAEGVGACSHIQVVLKADAARTAILRCADDGDVRSSLHANRQIGGHGRDSLPRFTVCQTGHGKLLVAVEISHVLMDATSIEVLKRDLALAYDDKLASTSGASYSDYVAYVERSRSDAALEYWRDYLKDCSPCYFPRLKDGSHPGDLAAEQHSVLVPFEYASELDAFCRETGLTMSNVVQVAWGLVLRAFTGLDSVLFGYVTSGRDAPVAGIEAAVGPYINVLVCRVDFDRSATLLETVHKAQRDFMQGVSSPYFSLAELFHSSQKMFNTGITFPPELQESKQHEGYISFQELERVLPDEYDITVECRVKNGSFTASLLYSPSALSESHAIRMAHNLNKAIAIIIQQSGMQAVAPLLSDMDRRQLEQWNRVVPARVEQCVHELIAERCQARPHAPAVCAWDGEFTYGELERLSSALAAHLARLGVGPEVFVPLLFEKSRWTTVAMLGVMKAGGAFVLLDPSHPQARLTAICRAVSAGVIVASVPQAARAEQLGTQVVFIGPDDLRDLDNTATWVRHLVMPDAALYVVFTSGSTGKPKGAVVTHTAYCTGAMSHSQAFDLSATSRAFQFSSYAFDASIVEQLTTLLVGGCICIPSDADRQNNIEAAVGRLGVTWAMVTPSTSRVLDPAKVSALKTLVLIGEPVTSTDINRWVGQVDLKNGYGPAECSACSTVQSVTEKRSDVRNIGQATGGVCWVVDPLDHERLLPIQAVGELLIEGPIVGRGYLNDPENTAAAFIDPPTWLREFRAAHPGNPGGDRVYKTGDLVQYAADGSLRFIGRKDTQVKLRGQRIELGEVEHHTRDCFPGARDVVAEVVTPADEGRAPILMAFVWMDGNDDEDRMKDLLVPPSDNFRAAVPTTEAALQDAVPAYMVPAVFLPVSKIPLTATGKTDRRRLRERAAALSWAEIESYRARACAKRAPMTAAERTLQQVWARVLNLPLDAIGTDDSFFRLGGDSITAMQLSSLARTEGFTFSVSDIFHNKTIAALAPFVGMDRQRPFDVQEFDNVPFDLSPIQRLFFEFMPNEAHYFNQSFLIPLAASIATQDLARAIPAIVDRHSMLRARFSQRSDGGWSQVVCTDVESSYRYRYSTVPSLEEAADIMHTSQQSLDFRNGPLLSVDLIDVSPGQEQYVFLTAHHLVVDLVSWRIILADLEDLLRSGHISGQQTLPFQAWCQIQADYARDALDPARALPFTLPPAAADYWGSVDRLNQVNTCDNATHSSFTVSQEITAILFGKANDALQTQPVEIFQAAVWHAFVRTFPDRLPPAIYCEGHGREPWDHSIDLSRTVGWFTTMWPLCIAMDGDNDSIVDVVRRSKDARRLTPSNGWAYFASRFLNPDGQQTFNTHGPVEIAFNYLGLYQQFERDGALLRPPVVLKDHIPDASGNMTRFALIDVTAGVNRGCLQFSFHHNRYMNNQDGIRRWIRNCEKSLKEATDKLVNMGRKYTLCDFPLLSLPYEMLDPLVDHVQSRSVRTDDSRPYKPKPHFVSMDRITGNIADILPATSCQIWFLTCWKFSYFSFSIDGQIDPARLQSAVQRVVEKYAALRTIFCEYHGSTLQVILKQSCADFDHIFTNKPPDLILKDLSDQDVGQSLFSTVPLLKVTLVSRHCGGHTLVIRMHHAQFDRYSLQPVLQDLAIAYNGDTLSSSTATSFSDYVYYCYQNNSEAAKQFWREHLQGSEVTKLPFSLNGRCDNLIPICECASIDLPHPPLDMTFPILVNAAVALVLGKLVNSTDVVFGVIVNTRSIPLEGIETILGPCLNTLPFRVRLSQYHLVKDLCIDAQKQYANMLQYCYSELPDIARPTTRGPINTRLNYIVNNTHAYGDPGLVPLNGVTWSESSVSEKIDLQDQVLIRSITLGGKLTIEVLTSADDHSREDLSEFAAALAKNVLSTVQLFCEDPESHLSSILPQL